MPSIRSAALAALTAVTALAASDVTQLQTDTFEPFVKEHDLVLAVRLVPVFLSAAQHTDDPCRSFSHRGAVIGKP